MKCYKRVPDTGWEPLIVKGVKPHKKTGILWLRLRTPEHLIARRAELEAMGVDFRVEHHRSLETRDRKKAASAYGEKRGEIESIWADWELLLAQGPKALNHRNIVALAGEWATAFFAQHEDEPFEVPPDPDIPAPPPDDGPWLAAVVERLTEDERKAFTKDLKRYVDAKGERRHKQVFAMLAKYPAIWKELGPPLAATLEEMAGQDTDKALAAKGLRVDGTTRRLLNFEMVRLMGAARRGLVQRQAGDWGEVKGLDALPSYVPPAPVASNNGGTWSDGVKELTFDSVMAEQRRLSDLRLDKQVKSPETFRHYRDHCEKFAEWRGSRNMLTVTAAEVARHRDELLALAELGKIRRKTVINRVTTIRSVIRWAISHNKRDRQEGKDVPVLFPDGNPLANIDLPEKQVVESEERTLTKGQSRKLLQVSRKETDPILRWGQWILTYSGMRVGELVQLEKRDVNEYEGHWYLMVRVDDERTTKTRKSRRVPIHKAIIAEGFLEFVKAAPDGRLFAGSLSHAADKIRDWVRSVLHEGSEEPLNGRPPLHGSRHLFRDIAMGHIEYGARNYIEGRTVEGSGEDYGRSAAMVPKLSKMMDEIEPLIPMRKVSKIASENRK